MHLCLLSTYFFKKASLLNLLIWKVANLLTSMLNLCKYLDNVEFCIIFHQPYSIHIKSSAYQVSWKNFSSWFFCPWRMIYFRPTKGTFKNYVGNILDFLHLPSLPIPLLTISLNKPCASPFSLPFGPRSFWKPLTMVRVRPLLLLHWVVLHSLLVIK